MFSGAGAQRGNRVAMCRAKTAHELGAEPSGKQASEGTEAAAKPAAQARAEAGAPAATARNASGPGGAKECRSAAAQHRTAAQSWYGESPAGTGKPTRQWKSPAECGWGIRPAPEFQREPSSQCDGASARIHARRAPEIAAG